MRTDSGDKRHTPSEYEHGAGGYPAGEQAGSAYAASSRRVVWTGLIHRSNASCLHLGVVAKGAGTALTRGPNWTTFALGENGREAGAVRTPIVRGDPTAHRLLVPACGRSAQSPCRREGCRLSTFRPRACWQPASRGAARRARAAALRDTASLELSAGSGSSQCWRGAAQSTLPRKGPAERGQSSVVLALVPPVVW